MKTTLITTIIILLALTTNIRANELINSNKISSKQISCGDAMIGCVEIK
jgi:hypothetical protein